jgi:hypothetical protein
VGIRDWGQHVDSVGKRWERTLIWARSRVLTYPQVAPPFTRTVTRGDSKNNLCDSHTLCAVAIAIAGGRTRPLPPVVSGRFKVSKDRKLSQ